MIYFSRMCSLLIWWCWASTCELSRLSLGIRCSSWHYWYFLGVLYFVSPVCIYVCIYIYIDTQCSYGRYMLAFWYHSGSCVARCNGCHVWCLTKMSCDKYFKEKGGKVGETSSCSLRFLFQAATWRGIISQESNWFMDVPQFYPTQERSFMISNLKQKTTLHFPAPSHTVDASEILGKIGREEYPTIQVRSIVIHPVGSLSRFLNHQQYRRLHQSGSWGRSFRVWRAISGGYATKGLWSIGWGLAFGHSLLCISANQCGDSKSATSMS